MKDYDEIRLRRYFLDQLNQDEKDQVEQDLLFDDDLFEAADAVEADLLDAYARGELAGEERESIVRRLATSPRGQARLALVRNLSRVADEARKPPVIPFPTPVKRQARPFTRFAIAASLVGVLATGFWALNNVPHAAGAIVEIAFPVLQPQLRNSGGGERQTAILSPADTLRINLRDLERDDFPAYEVVVSQGDEEEVARERLESGDTSVEVSAERLPEGLYGLEVLGLPADGEPQSVFRSAFEVVAE